MRTFVVVRGTQFTSVFWESKDDPGLSSQTLYLPSLNVLLNNRNWGICLRIELWSINHLIISKITIQNVILKQISQFGVRRPLQGRRLLLLNHAVQCWTNYPVSQCFVSRSLSTSIWVKGQNDSECPTLFTMTEIRNWITGRESAKNRVCTWILSIAELGGTMIVYDSGPSNTEASPSWKGQKNTIEQIYRSIPHPEDLPLKNWQVKVRHEQTSRVILKNVHEFIVPWSMISTSITAVCRDVVSVESIAAVLDAGKMITAIDNLSRTTYRTVSSPPFLSDLRSMQRTAFSNLLHSRNEVLTINLIFDLWSLETHLVLVASSTLLLSSRTQMWGLKERCEKAKYQGQTQSAVNF